MLRQRRRWRSTNLLERSLGEVKRRTKVIGRFPGETSCLTLVWAVLDLYMTHATNVATTTAATLCATSAAKRSSLRLVGRVPELL